LGLIGKSPGKLTSTKMNFNMNDFQCQAADILPDTKDGRKCQVKAKILSIETQ
jgi:hypothetical protein